VSLRNLGKERKKGNHAVVGESRKVFMSSQERATVKASTQKKKAGIKIETRRNQDGEGKSYKYILGRGARRNPGKPSK